MKKLNIAAVAVSCIAWLGSGCGGSDNDTNPEKSYRVVQIEGCEYIYVSRRPWGGDFALTHKGNCKSPIHGGKQ